MTPLDLLLIGLAFVAAAIALAIVALVIGATVTAIRHARAARNPARLRDDHRII